MNEPGKTGQGISYWPEFDWVDWPAELPRPAQERVMEAAYLLIGLDYGSSSARHTVKHSKAAYKPLLVCAAVPALVGVCGCSMSEAARVIGLGREIRRADQVMRAASTPAARLLGGRVVEDLKAEQLRERRIDASLRSLREAEASGVPRPRVEGGQG